MAGVMRRMLDRFSTDKVGAGELKDGASRAGCQSIESQAERCVASIHGVLRSVTLRPVDGVTALEAQLYDGSGSVTLIWLGRRQIQGIGPGRELTASGRIGRRGDERIMYNPRYVLDA